MLSGTFYIESEISKGINFPCDCGRIYKYKSSWYQHKKYECGKDAQFPCHYCNYKARQKRTLNAHMCSQHKSIFLELRRQQSIIVQENL